ncbi:hypothetical protein OB905_04010 [Halobacteria archaeon AArc-dxtr1]|nr:hypothetical protein [Halobacteria archaeon AArc-dxtr1]
MVLSLLGLLLVAAAPHYTNETVSDLHDDPGLAFGWGLFVGVLGPIVFAVIALTIIGLLVAISILSIVGTAVAVVWVGTTLTRASGVAADLKAALVGPLVISVPGSIPVLGDLVLWAVGMFGLGVVSKRLYHSWRGSESSTPDRESAYDRRDRLGDGNRQYLFPTAACAHL